MKIRIIPILIAFILALFSMHVSGQETGDIKVPDKVKKKESFHLYLLIGGANMRIKNTFADAGNKSDSRIFLFEGGEEWVSAEDYIKSSDGKTEEEGTGPSIFFAESMFTGKKGNDAVIGLVNCAEDGSELADWMKGGKCYRKAVEVTKLAMKTGVLKGILWHQANSEMKKADPLKYAENIGKIAMDLRKDLNSSDFHPIPFVGGKLVSYPYEFEKEKDQFKELNYTLQKTFSDTDRSGIVESKGLKDSGDGIHFDAESMFELGKRYADAMLYLEGKQKTIDKKKTEDKKKSAYDR
jgi:hypothetical protein